MTRPALVIGLGGTGQWTLTYLKKDLIESNNGQMPDNVRLLAFDTVVIPGAVAKGVVDAGPDEETKEVRVGGVTLKRNEEFVHLGGNLLGDAKAVEAGQLPYVGSWFRASEWLKVPHGLLGLSYGSGQLRQLSRFALFMDLKTPTLSRVWNRLNSSLTALAQTMAKGDQLTIAIVASLAGGTGSGIMVDFALLAQHLARDVKRLNAQVCGYLVLPRAFTATPDEDMKARAFAVWRELSRLMTVRDDFALPTVVYHPTQQTLQIKEVRRSLFDACYLMDGVRGGTQVAARAEDGVLPIVAEAIATVLDDRSGRVYMEYVANVAKTYVQKPGVSFYSTLGAHTFKVPVYYAQQSFTNNLTIRWLDRLARPIFDDTENKIRPTRLNPTSPYDHTKIGRQEALSLLTGSQEYQGQSEVPTLFHGRIADILTRGGPDTDDLVDEHARGSFGRARGRGYTWLEDFTDLGRRDDIADTVKRVNDEARLKVTAAVKASKDNKMPPRQWPQYAEQNIVPFVRQHYGFRTVEGGENRGKFGEALDECGQAQVEIFRRLVRLWLLRSLMSGDKSGRIGYAWDLLDGLVGELDRFIVFLDKVRKKREALNPSSSAEKERNKKRQEMINYSTKKFLVIFDDPKTFSTQDAYLKAEQGVIDVRKDDLLHGTVLATARAMRDYCDQVRAELARWIRVLILGDPVASIEGLYTTLNRRQAQILETTQKEGELDAAQTQLISIQNLRASEAEEEAELKRLMEGITWSIKEADGQFQLELAVAPRDETGIRFERAAGSDHARQSEQLTQRNLQALYGLASRRYAQLPGETRAAEQLLKQYETAKKFAPAIKEKAEPLFEERPGNEEGPTVWAELICAKSDGISPEAAAFLKATEHQRRVDYGVDQDKPNLDQLVQAVDSSNPYRCTVVTTRDLYPVHAFRAWHEYEEAYRTNQQMPPALNHNFPAEVNAAEWESKLQRRRGLGYEIFHPWVVMLLEYPERVKQFVRAWALGWIRFRDDGALKWYELDAPGFTQRYKRPFRLTPQTNDAPSIFQVMRAFVLVGRDQTPGAAWPLDYDAVERQLLQEERERGPEEWLALLERQRGDIAEPSDLADEQLFVPWLRARIAELDEIVKLGEHLPAGEPVDFEKAYHNLTDVVELMLEEWIETKRRDVEKRARARTAGA